MTKICRCLLFNVFIMFALFIFSKMCQEDISTHTRYTCASTVANFKVESDGTIYIIYHSVPITSGKVTKGSCQQLLLLIFLFRHRIQIVLVVIHNLRISIGRIWVVTCWISSTKIFQPRQSLSECTRLRTESLFYKTYRLLHEKVHYLWGVVDVSKMNEWAKRKSEFSDTKTDNECVDTVQSTFHAVIWFSPSTKFPSFLSAKQMSSYIFNPSTWKQFVASTKT